jgi:hypothetical protein
VQGRRCSHLLPGPTAVPGPCEAVRASCMPFPHQFQKARLAVFGCALQRPTQCGAVSHCRAAHIKDLTRRAPRPHCGMADMNIPDATVLEFHTEDALTIALRESGAAAGAPAYTITRSRDLKTTQLRAGGADAPVAELVFRDILPDTVALRGAPAGRLGAWLHSRNRLCVPHSAAGPRRR